MRTQERAPLFLFKIIFRHCTRDVSHWLSCTLTTSKILSKIKNKAEILNFYLPESMISKRIGHLLCSATLIHWTPWMFLLLNRFLCSSLVSKSFAHKEVRVQDREASLSCPRFISTRSTSFDGVVPLKLRSLFFTSRFPGKSVVSHRNGLWKLDH